MKRKISILPKNSIEIGQVSFNNPIWVASGTFGYGTEAPELVDVEKLGAIVTKSITLHPREGNPPPRIVETPVQKVKREQKQKAPKRKSNPAPQKTTYRKSGTQNNLIYRVIPLWRVEYSSTQKQRDNGDFKQEKFYGESTGKSPVPTDVRQNFWDDNIEPPNSTGETNSSIVSANEASLLNSGRYFSSTYIAKYDNR